MSHPLSLSQLPLREMQSQLGEKYSYTADLSQCLNMQKLQVYFEILPPGRKASKSHYHSHKEEMLVILEGQGLLNVGQDCYLLNPGDAFGFQPGREALHVLENQGEVDLRYLIITHFSPEDTIVWGETAP
ncbi:hypothetical protein COW36_08600 [bacterium (Candidatus Blackallbacteria) CG17_big_fil_post_rev_8_21_14_2_50_48_46]|uniref:Cupin type-2 domain-containing protein n=1 Tax=bacterium (Candidatus Blackallbacteria) CG17_big_fil_post_rev_8_21_14_2_50_48_46 TaxID=2014261 RepID=A0A2M7G781_9BACT|nr:MAG: hypothetical protein COW64_05900 [bacterium (Candidatus Blackallbacteria) CG18_big_fil_WC_8_21_14_2_50_49_26]PIW17546.1 MAG: hypothetical protein COW36_08600 [bacterium (Candidatus Blackallbacteria) CG17_big_fil_post_rev_8_21_14_2_50_48_46]PIW48401.1 MAG: hypothetical protein COW20_09950 [bacterium (Candidatus Blackallbacteria) CG13_big_fil_rev_8_21_14_2_50_49_14]